MIEVRLEALLIDSSNNSPVMLLREAAGDRVLPVFIGPLEASAITYAQNKARFPRPLTLDLMKLIIDGLDGKLLRVIITKIESDTYYAELIIAAGDRLVSIDARPSDSVGLALRAEAPVFVADEVMDKAGQWVSPADEDRLKELRAKMRTIDPESFGNYRM